MAIITPSVSVRGQGTCTYQPVNPVTEIITYSSSRYCEVVFMPYTITATPAAGWEFDHYEIHTEQQWSSGSVYSETIDSTQNPRVLFDHNPYPDNPYPVNWPASRWLGEWTNYNTAAQTVNHSYYLKYEITAVFVRAKTHLLVNSSTVETPAKLVYDPSTNLLVADY